MTPRIAVFYHGLFTHGTPRELRPGAFAIISDAFAYLDRSGLADAAQEIHACFNGPEEDRQYADLVVPTKAQVTMHGPDSYAENLTIVKLWEWAKAHPGWFILYFHAKGATHDPESGYAKGVSAPWREAMLRHLVGNWKECVQRLSVGNDIVCCHFLWNMCDGTQHIPAGNFLWARSEFVASLPSMHLRERIKSDGIASASSRYEAEVFWGNGRKPNVFQWLPSGGEGVP